MNVTQNGNITLQNKLPSFFSRPKLIFPNFCAANKCIIPLTMVGRQANYQRLVRWLLNSNLR